MNLWKKSGGFTLVELIVVIAILAILAGVAVPAYSGYVDKANKGADQTLIRDVKQALELYYYSNPTTVTSGYVVLSQEGTEPALNGIDEAAMEAVFGDNWKETVSLKYADWAGDTAAATYANTNYSGKEDRLVGEVNGLTNALSAAIKDTPDLVGDNFSEFLKGYGLENSTDYDAISNAAVLYVADQTTGKETVINTAITNALNKCTQSGDYTQFVNEAYANLTTGDNKLNNVAALATIYASLEGLALASGNTAEFNVDLSLEEGKTMDAMTALGRIDNAYTALLGKCTADDLAYIDTTNETGILNDLKGYVGIMGTVNNNKNIIDVNNPEAFTDGSVKKLLTDYAAMGEMGVSTSNGQVAIALVVGDGVVSTPVSPVTWNK